MNTLDSQDKRQFTRITFDSPVYLSTDTATWQSELVDISLNGVLIDRPADWQGSLGDIFKLTLDLNESDVEIRMEVEVAHMEDDHIGFHCKHIDLDSITHLRRLVELNVGNTEILNRELSALGG
ncbi:PilZ domain-containing protein [Kaarinaea lacus]